MPARAVEEHAMWDYRSRVLARAQYQHDQTPVWRPVVQRAARAGAGVALVTGSGAKVWHLTGGYAGLGTRLLLVAASTVVAAWMWHAWRSGR